MSNLEYGEGETSVGERTFICNICDKGFRRRKDLKSHSVTHLNFKPFQCVFCPEAFKHKGSLTRHSLIHSGEKPFNCGVCDKSFRQKGTLNEHLLTHSMKKPHECEFCNMKFTTKSNYSRHIRQHIVEKPFVCIFCSKAFNIISEFKSHYKTHLTIPSDIEDKIFSDNTTNKVDNKSNLSKNHMAPYVFFVSANSTEVMNSNTILCDSDHDHSNVIKEQYLCSICYKIFSSFSVFSNHQDCQELNSFACFICEEQFQKRQFLQDHLETHKEFLCLSDTVLPNNVLQNSYVCSKCHKLYHDEADFAYHMLIHNIPGPFKCDICIEVRFKQLSEFHSHYYIHDEISCLCCVCKKTSENNFNIQDLEQSIFSCRMCYKCFADKTFLKKHISLHKDIFRNKSKAVKFFTPHKQFHMKKKSQSSNINMQQNVIVSSKLKVTNSTAKPNLNHKKIKMSHSITNEQVNRLSILNSEDDISADLSIVQVKNSDYIQNEVGIAYNSKSERVNNSDLNREVVDIKHNLNSEPVHMSLNIKNKRISVTPKENTKIISVSPKNKKIIDGSSDDKNQMNVSVNNRRKTVTITNEDGVLRKLYICTHCGKSFPKEVAYKHHMIIHKVPGPFQCGICFEHTHFEQLQELHAHYSEHDETPCLCFICNESKLNDPKYMDQNVKIKFFKCSTCHKCFPNFNLLLKHAFAAHKVKKPTVVRLDV